MSEQKIPTNEPVAPVGEGIADVEKITFYSHSQLFYYWPLWLTSLVFAAITHFTGQEYIIRAAEGANKAITAKMVTSPSLGLAYLIILICVILFTAVDIRGLWAALSAAFMIIVGLIFSLYGVWQPILKAIGDINFFLNLHFYLWSGAILFALWAVVILGFDRRRYIEYRPTQLTIVEEVGDGEKNYDTTGLNFDKKHDNFFQHWILGFGSGDLKIKIPGAQHEIHFPNVLMIRNRIAQIHELREHRGRSLPTPPKA